MTTPTLDSGAIDLGTVQKPEKITLDNALFKKNLPGTSSGGSLALDVFGKSRTISFKGIKSGSEAQLKTFVEQMDSWANDTIQERKVFKSSLNKTYTVRCDVWDYEIYHNRVEYKLVLVEAGVI